MKILHITETMASGVLKYLQEAVSAVESEGREQTIVYSVREYTPADLQSLFPASVRLIRLDMALSTGFGTILALRRLIRKIQPDVIHLHSSIAGMWGRLAAVGIPNVRVYYTPHGYSFLISNKGVHVRAAYWLSELALSHATGRVVACSRSELRYARYLSPFRRVLLVENAIDRHKLQVSAVEAPVRKVIGIGRMEEQKHPKLFVEIAAKYRRLDSSIRFVWVGDGSLLGECMELSRKTGADVEFTGWLSQAETLQHLAGSSVLLQTSRWEGLPYTLLEAFALGVPVVASDIPSHRDLFEGIYGGWLAGHPDEFGECLAEVLAGGDIVERRSEDNRQAVGRSHVTFTERLRWVYDGKNSGEAYAPARRKPI